MKKDFSISDNFNYDDISGINSSVEKKFNEAKSNIGITDSVIDIDCKKIDNWIYRDRLESELGDINQLAESIKNKGQAQPIIIVSSSNIFIPKNDKSAKYVVIAGYRRWLACKQSNIYVKAIIKNINFNEAIKILDAENEKQSVSEYSKGMLYSKLINDRKMTFDSLVKDLNISKGGLSNLLSYSEIPNTLISAIGNMYKVSPRTSAYIRRVIKDSPKKLEKLIENANKIKNGAGETTLRKILSEDTKTPSYKNPVQVTNNFIKVNKGALTSEKIQLIEEFIKEVIESE